MDRRGESIPGKRCDLCTVQGMHLIEGSRFQGGEPHFLTYRLFCFFSNRAGKFEDSRIQSKLYLMLKRDFYSPFKPLVESKTT